MTVKKSFQIFLLLLGLREPVQAAVPSVRLRTTLSSDQSALTVLFSPDTTATGCRYDLFTSEEKKDLSKDFKTARRLVSLDGNATRSALQTFRVPQLRKRDQKNSAERIYFAARTKCGRESKISNLTSIRLSLQKRSGEKSFKSWVQILSKRLLPRLVTLDRAFPNLSFNSPVALENAGDGTDRLFLVQQGGQILVFQNDNSVQSATTFLDLSGRITTGGERGLLGLAFHPNYRTNGFFYVNYTDLAGNTVVSRFQRSSGDSNVADANSELVLLGITQPFANHNGGALTFGLDGFLYISVGDGGSGGDPLGNGQNRATLLGKILRIDVDHAAGGLNYSIPSENPYRGNLTGFREEIFAFGVRNPWRMSIDPVTGLLWAGDVGQNSYEEVDVISAGGNYGWNTMEGFHCYSPSSGCDQSGLTLPLAEYSHSVGNSITGGYVYRGSENPSLDGVYVYADFISGVIFGLSQDGGRTQVNQLFATDHLISSFGVDEGRELFLLSYGDGEIYRFSAN